MYNPSVADLALSIQPQVPVWKTIKCPLSICLQYVFNIWLVLLCLFTTSSLFAQHPGFEIIYPPTSEAGVALTSVGDDEYLLLGGKGLAIGQNAIVLRKVDGAGNEIWERYLHEGGASYPQSILVKDTGRPVIAGQSNESNAVPNQYEAFIAELDAEGEQLWRKYYGGDQGNSAFYSIIQTDDSGYLAAGGSSTFSEGSAYDVYVVKTDSVGDTLWTLTWGSANWLEYALQVVPHPEGGYAVAGLATSSETGMDMLLMRISDDGEILWTQTFDFNGNEMAYSLAITSDMQYVLGGYSYETINPPFEPYQNCIAKADENGELLWFKRYWGFGGDRIYHVLLDEEDNIYATGKANSYAPSWPSPGAGYLMKLNTEGDSLWCRVFFDGASVDLWNMIRTPDSGFMIIGKTTSRMYLIRTDVWGCTVEGCQLETSITEHSAEGDLFTVFPNPTTNTLYMSLKSAHFSGALDVSIFSADGKLVHRSSTNHRGDEFLAQDVSFLPDGMYIIQIMDAKQKMAVQRFVKH